MDKKRSRRVWALLLIAVFAINIVDILYTAIVHHKADVSSIIITSATSITFIIFAYELRRKRNQ